MSRKNYNLDVLSLAAHFCLAPFLGLGSTLNLGGCSEVVFKDSERPLTALECYEDYAAEVVCGCSTSHIVSECSKSIVNSCASVIAQLKAAGLGKAAVKSFVT